MTNYPPNESSKWLPIHKQIREKGIYSFSDVFSLLWIALKSIISEN